MPDIGEWTEQDKRNAMLYGICPVCGTPREMEMVATAEGDSVDVELRFDPTTCEHVGQWDA